ncbi:hypothetical protein V496_06999 [Pseudogymnoascus sp. VKM F-4515 (FW-2607)]|nr:hypothetical protein V496_06999 [Pseudogymnoascus sp. VKM F-4515 (FW-2607)]
MALSAMVSALSDAANAGASWWNAYSASQCTRSEEGDGRCGEDCSHWKEEVVRLQRELEMLERELYGYRGSGGGSR